MSGIFYGIGLGPGDPELMTLKAVRIVKEVDYIVLPGTDRDSSRAYKIVTGAIKDLNEKKLIFMPFPMKMDAELLDEFHHNTANSIEKLLDSNMSVGFLTIGDPSIYSTLMYIKEIVEEHGYKCEMISGVPSFCAAASRLGISLAQGNTPISIIPGSYNEENISEIPGTRVFMKSGKKLNELKEILENENRPSQIHYVSNCGMENEKIGHGIEALSDEPGYLTVVISVNSEK